MDNPLVMLDLFSGLGGASAAMAERGWKVLTVDNEERFKPSIVADVTFLPIEGLKIDLLWASPPCVEYSREDQPWTRKGIIPDASLYLASKAVIEVLKPRYWAIENVRGAVKWWGHWNYHFGPIYLWSNIPYLPQLTIAPFKQRYSGREREKRAKVPYLISEAVANAIEVLCATP